MHLRSHGKVLFKLLGAIAALALVVYGMKDRSEIASIRKRGKLATVEPITTYAEFKQRGSSTFTAEFRFKTDDGRHIAQKHSFPPEVLSDLKAGKSVQIIYLPDDPSTFVFAHEEAGWALVVGGVVLLVVALVFA